MVNIEISQTKLSKSVDLANQILKFFNEEEHGELAFYTDSQKRKLMDALKVLVSMAIKHRKK